LIKSDLEANNQDLYDISKNLFKVLCAILGLHINTKGQNYLDDKLLVTYLDTINFHRDDPDLVLIDQLATIKSLVNRKSFTMTQTQVALIQQKFSNMLDSRNSYFQLQQRSGTSNRQRIAQINTDSGKEFDQAYKQDGVQYIYKESRPQAQPMANQVQLQSSDRP
jgi:hypothetical protein